MNPRILVYTQAYNAEKTLRKTVESVLEQAYGNIEYHLLDNGSTDSTGEIIAEYAKRDPRIVRRSAGINDPFVYRGFWREMLDASRDTEYFMTIDADDEYSLDFIETMLEFIDEHDLDCAACGTRLVDLKSGEVIDERVLEKSMIIEGDFFSKDFLLYRRYYMQPWGKIYNTKLLRDYYAKIDCGSVRFPGIIDFEMVLGFLTNAGRAGILARVLHTFNQHPDSLTQTHFEGIHAHLTDWIAIIRNYLLGFGLLSKINQDYLHAIYLGQLDSILNVIYRLEIPVQDKLKLIIEIFRLPDTQNTLSCKADPQFRTLAARAEFLQSVKDWIVAQDGYERNVDLAQETISMLKPRRYLLYTED